MSWLNNSLSNIKGQITNFANEVLAEDEGKVNEELDKAKEKLIELENIIGHQNFEIANLRKQNAELSKREAEKKAPVAGTSGGAQNVQTMEDSWIWTEGDYDAEESSQEGEKKKRTDSPSATELKSRIFELEQENQTLASNLDELDSQHNAASQKLIQIKNELQKKYDGVVEELRAIKAGQGETEKLKEENNRLKVDLDKVQEDLSVLQDENFELQRITQEFKAGGGDNELKKLRDELQSLTRKCDDLTKDNERLKIDVDKIDEDRAVLQDDNFTLQDQLAQLRKNAEECNSVVDNLEMLKKENLELKTELEKLDKFKGDLEKLKKKEELLIQDNERLKVDFDKVQEDMSFLQDENFQLQEEIEMLKNSSVTCSSETSETIESLKKEIMQYKNELDILKKREVDLVSENERLKIDQDKIEEDRSVLQDENFELKDQIESLKNTTAPSDSFNDLKKENADLKEEINKLTDVKIDLEKLKKIEEELKFENERLKIDQDKIEEDRSVLQDLNFDLQEQITTLKNDVSALDNLKSEYANLKVEFDKLIQANSSSRRELDRLKIDYDKGEEDRSVLQDQNFELQNEIASLKEKLSSQNDIKCEEFKQENMNLQQQMDRLKIDLDKCEEDRSVLQDANFELQDEVIALKSNTSINETIEVLKKENLELKKEIEQNNRLKVDYEKLEEDLCVLQDKNLGYQEDIVDLNGKIQKHLTEIDELKQKINSLTIRSEEDNVGKFKEELEQYNRLKIDFDKVQEDCSVLQDENFDLQQKLKEITDKSPALKNQLQVLMDEKEKNLKELEVLKNKSSEVQERLDGKVSLEKELREANITLAAEKQAMSLELAHYEKELADLMKNYDKIYLELEEVKSSKLETISEKNEECFLNLEQQLENCSSLNQSLEDQYKNLEEQLEHEINEKKKLEEKLATCNENLAQAQTKLENLTMKYEQEKSNLLFEVNELKSMDKNTFQEMVNKCQEYEVALQSAIQGHENLLKENAYLKQELQKSVQRLEGHNPKIQILDSKSGVVQHHMDSNQMEKLKSELQTALDTIESLKNQNVDLYNKTTTELQNQKATEITLRHELDNLRQQLNAADLNKNVMEPNVKINMQQQYIDLKNKFDDVVKENENLKSLCQQTVQLQTAYTALTNEKNELIKVLKGKHEENVTYHAEIQRLNALLQAELAKSQSQGLIDPASVEKLNDQVAFLREKCDILTNSLVTEQTNVKLLNQEKREVEEKATAALKELERLRQHLVEVENSHTQEIMELDMRNNELQTKISSIEEHAIYNNTAYTSASIRANQQAETLQTQLNLMSQQRDELLAKMSDTEDKYNKQVAALTNLQCALEQFQRDKDQEIQMCTERIRAQLETERKEQTALRNELQALRTQLSEQQQGLMAAGRLASQLETSQSTVQSLKQELNESQTKYANLQAKIESNKNNQADKIEKSLVKNLMLGYITAGQQNDKAQILKIISAVLDFNQSECDRIGLLSNQKSSWFGGGSLLRLGEEGLAKAFVEFLEKESLPRPNRDAAGGPSLLQIQKERRESESKAQNPSPVQGAGTSQPPVSGSGNALLSQTAHENVLPTFAPPRSASSILKDVLKDSNT